MTQIERRQARIRRIRQRLENKGEKMLEPELALSPTAHYHIGKTQNQPVHVMSFMYTNSHDPAVKVIQYLAFSLDIVLTCQMAGVCSTSEGSYIVTYPAYVAA